MDRSVTVQDVMDREYVGASESDDLADTVELLLHNEAETAVVQRGSEYVGVLTHEDVMALVAERVDPDGLTVGEAMTESVPTVSPDTGLDGAADRMSTRGSRRLVVTDGTQPLGIVTERELLASRAFSTREPTAEDVVSPGSSGVETAADEASGFQDQSICERCGTFASDLSSFNGQLVCTDCRAM